jgi:predicted MPP superfamily phosphohydrolase
VLIVWILLAMLAAGLACVAYGVFIERRSYRLVRHRLDILPTRSGGGATAEDGAAPSFTILHLSDLHFVRRDDRKRAFLAALPRADVTVITGDLLGEPEAA